MSIFPRISQSLLNFAKKGPSHWPSWQETQAHASSLWRSPLGKVAPPRLFIRDAVHAILFSGRDEGVRKVLFKFDLDSLLLSRGSTILVLSEYISERSRQLRHLDASFHYTSLVR